MERKTTKLKYLLLIPAFLFGMNLFAQKADPVNKGPVQKTVQNSDATSNYRPAHWKLESEVYNALEETPAPAKNVSGASAKSPVQQPVSTQNLNEQEAAKVEAVNARETHMVQKAAQLANQSVSSDITPNQFEGAINPKSSDNTDTQWDVLLQWVTNNTALGATAIETDGNYIYIGYWATAGTYEKYDLSGNFVSTVSMPGASAGGARDMCYDGEYFYLAVNSTTVYKVDFATQTVVGTISMPEAVRHISYDPGLDAGAGGFWIGNWTTLRSVTMSGTTIAVQSIGAPSIYGSAYDNYSVPGAPCLWLFDQSNPYPSASLRQWDIATATFTGVTHNVLPDLTPTPPAGSLAGGLGSSAAMVPGKFVLLGCLQTGVAPFSAFVYEMANTIVYTHDVGVKAILSPVSGPALGASEQVTVRVQNYGSTDETTFPVFFTINGGTPISTTYNGLLAPNATVDIQVGLADLSAYGSFTLYACTALGSDLQAANDCKTVTVVHSLPTLTDTIYPGSAPYWTGTSNGTTFTQNSLVNFESMTYGGYAKFDLSVLPAGSVIQNAKMRWYVNFQSGAPYYSLTRLIDDPMISTAATVKTQITTGTVYVGSMTGEYAIGWHEKVMPAAAITNMAAAQSFPSPWWAVGFYEYESCNACYRGSVDGWSEANRPYLVVTYGYIPYPNDVGVSSLVAPVSSPSLFNNTVVTVRIRNYGTNPQTNIPVSYQVNGGAVVTEICPGPIAPIATFDYTFTQTASMNTYGASYAIHACTGLVGDQNTANDCKNFSVTKLLPVAQDTLYPQSMPYWTGTTNGTTFTQNSLINFESMTYQGYAKFFNPGLYPGGTINSLSFRYYMNFQSGAPYFNVKQMLQDPMANTASQVRSNIIASPTYFSTTAGYSVGWHTFDLGVLAKTDFLNSLGASLDWFALGIHEYESCNACYRGSMDGWAEQRRPHLIVNYTYMPLAHDVGALSVNFGPYILQGVTNVSATVKNFGLNDETFNVTVSGPNGYTSAINNVFVATGQTLTVTFPDQWTATPGYGQPMTVCAVLAGDMWPGNDCKTKQVNVDASQTQVYGYIAADLTTPAFAEGPCKFFLEHPENLTPMATTTSPDFLAAGAWANNTGGENAWYGAEYYAPPSYNHGHLYKINTTTGAMTSLGAIGVGINGMTYDMTTNTMYGLASVSTGVNVWNTKLYTINLTTGVATQYADLGSEMGLPINLACSPGGLLYTVDLVTQRLYVIDPLSSMTQTAQVTFVETLPTGTWNYAQDAEFEYASGKLFLAAYTSNGRMYKYNPVQLNMQLVNDFAHGVEMTGFAIPFENAPATVDIAVKWINYPMSGNLTLAEPLGVAVRNLGQTAVDNFDLHYTFTNTATNQTISGTENWGFYTANYALLPGEEMTYAFQNVLDMSAPGMYIVKAWITNVVGDSKPQNDSSGKKIYNTACGSITCYPNYIQEPEDCALDLNGGCNMPTPQYTDMLNGQAFCGTTWLVDQFRDTDWYRFTLTSSKSVKVKGTAEFLCDFILVSLPCDQSNIIAFKTFNRCSTDSLEINMMPGTYALIVAPNFAEYDMTCLAHNKYTFRLALNPPKYCPAGATNNWEYISNVTIGTINNTTGMAPGQHYSNYTNLSTTLAVGTVYPMSVVNGFPYFADLCGAWIDYNQDFDWEDVGELISMNGNPGGGPYTANVSVPQTALPGPTTMRVRIIDGSVNTLSPCGITSWGEVEDYGVYISAPIPPIHVTAPTITEACPGIKSIPVTVTNFNNVNSFILSLSWTAGLTYSGNEFVNPALSSGQVVFNVSANTLQANWFSVTPTNIPDGQALFNLIYTTTPGAHNLIWTVGGSEPSQFTNLILGVMPSNYTDGLLTYGTCSDVSGNVNYLHFQTSPPYALQPVPMNNSTVSLYQGSTLAYSTITDNTGHYLFSTIANGTYNIKFATQKVHGGLNASDALAILRHFVQLPPMLTGLKITAADVNGNGIPNSADALAVSRRFVGQIPNFLPPNVSVPGGPDWYYETFSVVVDGTANKTQNLFALCAGDVNGSYIPPSTPSPFKQTPTVNLKSEGSLLIDGNIEVPVYAENAMTVGSISLVLNYPSNVEITGVTVANTSENLVYTAKDGNLRLAWFSTEPLNLKAGDVMLKLNVKASSIVKNDITFTTTEESVLANESAIDYDNVGLVMPKLVSNVSADDYSLSNYPNPFSQTTQISYTMPQAGFVTLKVFNVLGEEVVTLVNTDQTVGTHFVKFDATNLQKGVYYYKLDVNGVTKTKSMVIGD
jgi:hypothetical protein